MFSSPRMEPVASSGGGGKPHREGGGAPVLSFVREQAAGGLGDVGGVDAGGAEKFGRRAGAGHLTDGQVGDGQVGAAGAGQGVQDRGAEATFGVVVLGDDQPAAGGRGGGDERGGVGGLGDAAEIIIVDCSGSMNHPRTKMAEARAATRPELSHLPAAISL